MRSSKHKYSKAARPLSASPCPGGQRTADLFYLGAVAAYSYKPRADTMYTAPCRSADVPNVRCHAIHVPQNRLKNNLNFAKNRTRRAPPAFV